AMRPWKLFVPALVVLLVGPTHALPQSVVTGAEIERLQQSIERASRDVSQLQGRDPALASQLRRDLDDARDAPTYLKVKLRQNEPIAREDYWTLRDRIDNIQARASGGSPAGATTRESPPAGSINRGPRMPEIPVSTEFDVRLQNSLSSATSQVED